GNAKGLERFRSLQIIPDVFKEYRVLEALLVDVYNARGVRGEKPALDQGISSLAEKHSAKADVQGFDELRMMLLESPSTSIIFGPDLIQRTNGHRGLFAVSGLTYLLEARLYLLSEKPNEQGVIDAGCVPDMLPGGRPLNVYEFRRKFEEAWKGTVPPDDGLTLLEMIDGARNGKIRSMYIMGENPLFNLPDGQYIREALQSLDFLVVQDIFLTETAEIADVVLPAMGWTEKTGAYTNLERRIQLQKKAVNTLSGMEDWRIISGISGKMGYAMDYNEVQDIMTEMANVSPLYRDLTYREISSGNCLWPYHGEPLRGESTRVPEESEEAADYMEVFYLAVEKPLFHSGTLSGRSPALMKIYPEPLLRIGALVAKKIGLSEGDKVQFFTQAGSREALVSLDDSIRDNRIYYSNNFKGSGVLSLMSYKMDKVTKAPGIEGCEVKIKKL
ncbi:MAG: hypothetical protein C4538_10010, partial [Nitrospiraceae bacterium]